MLLILTAAAGLFAADTQGSLYQEARKGADKTGHYIKILNAKGNGHRINYTDLKNEADAIVVVRPIWHSSTLNKQGSDVLTTAKYNILRVSKSPKGDLSLAPNAVLTVTFPGGSYRYSDGTWVHSKSPNSFNPIQLDTTYLLMLSKQGGVWTLQNGVQDVVEFDANGRMTPGDRRVDSVGHILRFLKPSDVAAIVKAFE